MAYIVPISGMGVQQFTYVTNLCYTHFRWGCTAVYNCHQPMLYPFQVRVYGSFRTLTQKIQEYLQADNPGDLFAKILERMEDDFNIDNEDER